MAGPFSFLPLSNKPGLRARVEAKPQNERVLPEHRMSSSADVEMNDKDDEWYDTSSTSESGSSPLRKTKNANTKRSVVTVKQKQLSPEEEAELLPYMSALLGTDLPPCNAEIQIAYEIVNSRLRELWFNHRGRLGIVDVCQVVKDELRNQNYLWPPFSIKGQFKRRKPWCREVVFKYQLCWIDYFVREAQALAPELLTESEIMDRKKQPAIPTELNLHVDRKVVLELWDRWYGKKRAKTPVLPSVESETGLQTGAQDTNIGEITNKNLAKLSDNDSKEPMFPPSTPDAENDAHHWSQNDHD